MQCCLCHASCVQCPWWSWECFRELNRERDVTLRLVIFWSGAFTSATLYFLVIKQLRVTREKPRKLALIRAFICLYLLWLFCFVPYGILELYYLRNKMLDKGLIPISKPSDVKDSVAAGFLAFSPYVKRFVTVEAVLNTLRSSLGFFSSILLLILLKPFREPPLKLLEKAKKCCNRGPTG